MSATPFIFNTEPLTLDLTPAESNVQYFDKVFDNNLWNGEQSRSGPGSEGICANDKILCLKFILQKFNIKSIVDIGCGDMFWMKDLIVENSDVISYIGVDVSHSVIKENKRKAFPDHIQFKHTTEIDFERVEADSFIAFDVFGHMLHEEIVELLKRIIKSNVKYLIVTDRMNSNLDIGKTRLQGTCLKHYFNAPCVCAVPSVQNNDYYNVYKLR